MKIRDALLLFFTLFLVACTHKGRLYNLSTNEVIEFKYTVGNFIGGHGRVQMVVPTSGESFRGEYATIPRGSVGWGLIYGSVTSAGTPVSTGTAHAASFSVGADQPGTGIIVGNRGTRIECEYVTSAMTGHGNGVCKDNHGILYRLMF